MNTKTLSNHTLSVIDQYLHFRLGAAVCSVPYFNNKTVRARAALAANVGKGSPREIFEEVQAVSVKNHIVTDTLADESLKKIMVDNNIGIDCSGFAWYVLNAENDELKKGAFERHIHFVNAKGIMGRIAAALHPAKNADVATLANDKNSRVISLKNIQPGDIITMLGKEMPDSKSEADSSIGATTSSITNSGASERNHILVVHQVDYQNFLPIKIFYSHAVAYPEDGLMGTGIKQGSIEINNPEAPLIEGLWSESGSVSGASRIFARAQKSVTEVRRLLWW